MIVYKQGDILASECRILVNPVNCVGVAGKGLALAFKRRFPQAHFNYKTDCDLGNLHLGLPFIYFAESGREVVAFPTKRHWRDSSILAVIECGLINLRFAIDRLGLRRSIAIPALGCGLGGLSWSEVKPLIERIFGDYDGLVEVYEPHG